MSQKNSSRDIPLAELYSALQMEFIAYFVRSKIYRKDFADNYIKVCDQKRVKVDNISARNSLPSIFTNSDIKEKYIKKFIGLSGTPAFTYKDSDIKYKMERWDRFYYFCPGTSISFSPINSPIKSIGVIRLNDRENCIVKIEDELKVTHTLHYNNIQRLFPEDFFNF